MTDEPRTDVSNASQAITNADLTYSLDADDRPSEVVIRAVSSLTDTPILDLAPLYEVVDPDHLNGLFDEPQESGLRESSSVSFHFNGCTVTVTKNAVHVSKYSDDTE